MSELSDYRRLVSDPAEASYRATIASLRARERALLDRITALEEGLKDLRSAFIDEADNWTQHDALARASTLLKDS